MELVEVKKDRVFTDSSIVAKKFGIKHSSVMITIKRLYNELKVISNDPKKRYTLPELKKVQRNYRGHDYTAFLMDREFFSLLSMRFQGKKALEWQIKFNNAFYEMERHILQSELNKKDEGFLQLRSQGKQSRLEETNTIRDFVEYATNQGSKSAKFYYKHITNATYKALGLMIQRKPKLRDSLKGYEIAELMLAERLALNSLKKYMKLNRHYKDIYESVKDDLDNFVNSIRLSD